MRRVVAMHINYRRKNKPPSHWRSTHCRHHYPFGLYSYKAMRRAYWRRQRAIDRLLMVHGRYDLLQVRYPASILWDYW